MKLTKTMRDTFVTSVMADVPYVDYTEKMRAKMNEFALSFMPPAVRKLVDDPKCGPWLNMEFKYHNHIGAKVYAVRDVWTFTDKQKAELDTLDALHKAQESTRKTLREQLQAVALSCTTDNALREALPEFAKYVPAAPVSSRSVPALANVVANFVKAGWPAKGKKA